MTMGRYLGSRLWVTVVEQATKGVLPPNQNTLTQVKRGYQGHEVLTMRPKELVSRTVLSTVGAASHMGPYKLKLKSVKSQ